MPLWSSIAVRYSKPYRNSLKRRTNISFTTLLISSNRCVDSSFNHPCGYKVYCSFVFFLTKSKSSLKSSSEFDFRWAPYDCNQIKFCLKYLKCHISTTWTWFLLCVQVIILLFVHFSHSAYTDFVSFWKGRSKTFVTKCTKLENLKQLQKSSRFKQLWPNIRHFLSVYVAAQPQTRTTCSMHRSFLRCFPGQTWQNAQTATVIKSWWQNHFQHI